MKDRKITTAQLEILLAALPKHVSEFQKHLEDHKYLMGTKLGYDVGETVASFDYFFHHLLPFEKGYAMCFLDHVPEGQEFVPINSADRCEGACNHVSDLMRAQIPRLREEWSRNRWFLGEKRQCPVSEEDAVKDFNANYLPEWGRGFRTCYEERVCPLRTTCQASSSSITKVF